MTVTCPPKPPVYITTPIYYVNDQPHVGHAYTSVAADVLARFRRLDGHPVRFLTGTDEHGQKVQRSAEKAGEKEQAFVDRVSERFRTLTRDLHCAPDDFIRTTEPRHRQAVTFLWQTLQEKGWLFRGTYAGWYAVRDEAFYQEGELVHGKAPTGADVEWVEEDSWFFRLSAFQQPLLDFYRQNPGWVGPEGRMQELVSFVSSGLKDLSVSRGAFSWGIPVPGDEGQVVYVWMDALTNYIAALGYPAATPAMADFWPGAVHLMGKDILRFHGVYWPAFLMAAGLPLPRRLFAHGWWTRDGQKMSKSLGNVVDPAVWISHYGADAFRWFLIRHVPFGQDGDFSAESFQHRYVCDLAHDWGNLVQRVLSFVVRHQGGQIPPVHDLTPRDKELLDLGPGILQQVRTWMDQTALHRYPETVWTLVREANRYVDEQKPWALRTTDPARMATVLGVLGRVIVQIAVLLQPLMPVSSQKVLDMLAVPEDSRTFATLEGGVVCPGPVGGEVTPLFPARDGPATPVQQA